MALERVKPLMEVLGLIGSYLNVNVLSRASSELGPLLRGQRIVLILLLLANLSLPNP